MSEERVNINIENHIAAVQLNRPDKMNALDIPMFNAIIAAGEKVKEDASVRCVVLHGAGKAFCAGLDLSNFDMDPNSEINATPLPKRTFGIANKWQQVAWTWRTCPVPVIVAAHGVVFGGGLQIMSGADIKFVKADTKLSIMEMKWGLIPDMAGTQLWRHTVRDDVLRELTYTNRVFSGTQAVAYGFASHVADDPFEEAMALANEIATKSPSAIVKAKKVFNAAPYLNPEDGLMMESLEQEEIIRQHNQIEAVFSSMQKRPANYKDHR